MSESGFFMNIGAAFTGVMIFFLFLTGMSKPDIQSFAITRPNSSEIHSIDEQEQRLRRSIFIQREIIRHRWGDAALKSADNLVETEAMVSVDDLIGS